MGTRPPGNHTSTSVRPSVVEAARRRRRRHQTDTLEAGGPKRILSFSSELVVQAVAVSRSIRPSGYRARVLDVREFEFFRGDYLQRSASVGRDNKSGYQFKDRRYKNGQFNRKVNI